MKAKRSVAEITNSNTLAWRLRAACAARLLPLLLFLLPAAAQAQTYTNNYGIWNYETNYGTIAITGYTGSGSDVTIPNTINGLPVTTIGNDSFENNTSLTSVTIPSSVTTMGTGGFPAFGSEVFYNCPNLDRDLFPRQRSFQLLSVCARR